MIPDGCGTGHVTVARWYKESPLHVDSLGLTHVKTHCASSMITGSAAAATAFACGEKAWIKQVGLGADTAKGCKKDVKPQHCPGKPAASVLAAGIRDLETVDRKLVSRLEKDLPNLNLDAAALADLRNLTDFVNLASHHEALRTYLAAWVVSERFRRFLLGYAKAVNKERGQTGSLFQKIFRRRLVADDDGFQTLLMYIHRNPLLHQVAPDWEAYTWSSYRSYLSRLPSALPRADVLNRFGGRQAFVATHREYADDWKMIQRYIME